MQTLRLLKVRWGQNQLNPRPLVSSLSFQVLDTIDGSIQVLNSHFTNLKLTFLDSCRSTREYVLRRICHRLIDVTFEVSTDVDQRLGKELESFFHWRKSCLRKSATGIRFTGNNSCFRPLAFWYLTLAMPGHASIKAAAILDVLKRLKLFSFVPDV